MSFSAPETTDVGKSYFGSVDDLMNWCGKIAGTDKINNFSSYVSALLLSWFGLTFSEMAPINRKDVSFDDNHTAVTIVYIDDETSAGRELVIRNPRVYAYLKKYYDATFFLVGKRGSQLYKGDLLIRNGTGRQLDRRACANLGERLRKISADAGCEKCFGLHSTLISGRFAKLYAYAQYYGLPIRPRTPIGGEYLLYERLNKRTFGGSSSPGFLYRRWKIFYMWCKEYREVDQ